MKSSVANQREHVLARIRAALSKVERGADAWEDAEPDGPVWQQDWIEQFALASVSAGCEVSIVEQYDRVGSQIDEILAREGASRVAVSPDAALEPWLCGQGASLSGVRFFTRSSPSRETLGDLLSADAGITAAAYGLIDTGALVLLSSAEHHRLESLLPPVHIALLQASNLLPGLPELFARLARERAFSRHSAVTFVRGPSRTADIELTLTIGVHGPRKVHVIVLDDVLAACDATESVGGKATPLVG